MPLLSRFAIPHRRFGMFPFAKHSAIADRIRVWARRKFAHHYRPEGKTREQQRWLAPAWRSMK
jgi:hypothetical protein